MTDKGQPMVGIFWLLNGRLILDASPLSEAEPYGDCLTHRKSHINFWGEQQRAGALPREIEYEEPPRGRVVFNQTSQRFALYADRCILKKKSVVNQVMKAMCLPASKTDVSTDGIGGHYKCSQCLERLVRGEDNS